MIDRACVSLRIFSSLWMDDGMVGKLVDALEKRKGIVDQITLFTAETGAPLPLHVLDERMEMAAVRMHDMRALGYRSGINVLATIGHHDENLPHSLSGDYTHMTDISGNICRGGFCPNDERVRDYVKRLYEIVTVADPDYVWVDDDVRLFGHMPLDAVCFCDNCLALFAAECGAHYTRKSLDAAFNEGALADKLRVRKAWIEHNRITIDRLLELIERTVHRIRPELPIGLMTGDRFYEGYDFARWAGTLAGPGNAPVMWRPGGGFYNDNTLSELIGKSHDIGRQVAMLPGNVISMQSEVENFPYQSLKKSGHTTALEAASHMASGCTGTAFCVFFYDRNTPSDDPLREHSIILDRAHETRPFYDLLARTLGRTPVSGIYSGWSRDIFASNNLVEGRWFEGSIWDIADDHAVEVSEIGLPSAYCLDCASVTLLRGDSVFALSDREIRTILSSGVYMDAPALSNLNSLGYSALTGFGIENYLNDDCIEELTDHSLNGDSAGTRRNCRQAFKWWIRPAAVLLPCGEKAEVLARLVDYTREQIAPCTMGIFENSLGGRVCVAGYYPYTFLQSLPKSEQIKRVMRWLSKDNLLAYVDSFNKMSLWARSISENNVAAAIINTTLDPASHTALMLRTESEEIRIYDMRCHESVLRATGTDGPYRRFILPTIGAWEMRLAVTAGKNQI